MIYRFLSNKPSSGDINSSNLSFFFGLTHSYVEACSIDLLCISYNKLISVMSFLILDFSSDEMFH